MWPLSERSGHPMISPFAANIANGPKRPLRDPGPARRRAGHRTREAGNARPRDAMTPMTKIDIAAPEAAFDAG